MSKTKLSPFDYDMCVMIENIAKDNVRVETDDNKIRLILSVCEMEPQKVEAIKQAVKGRLGERLDWIDEQHNNLIISFEVDPEYLNAPDEYRFDLETPKEIAGTRYCRKLKEVNAVFFEERNIDKVIAFTGGGTLTTPSIMNEAPDGLKDPATYEFPTENGTLLKVFEGEYIVKDENGRFSKMYKTAFENDFEPK